MSAVNPLLCLSPSSHLTAMKMSTKATIFPATVFNKKYTTSSSFSQGLPQSPRARPPEWSPPPAPPILPSSSKSRGLAGAPPPSCDASISLPCPPDNGSRVQLVRWYFLEEDVSPEVFTNSAKQRVPSKVLAKCSRLSVRRGLLPYLKPEEFGPRLAFRNRGIGICKGHVLGRGKGGGSRVRCTVGVRR